MDWRESHSASERVRLIGRVTAVLAPPDCGLSEADRQRVQAAAEQFEASCYASATSQMAYARMIAERVVAMQEHLKNKRESVTLASPPQDHRARDSAVDQPSSLTQPAAVSSAGVAGRQGSFRAPQSSPASARSPRGSVLVLGEQRTASVAVGSTDSSGSSNTSEGHKFFERVGRETSNLSSWWPNCERRAAEEALLARTHPAFLIRPSSIPGAVTLSVRPGAGSVLHFLLRSDPQTEAWFIQDSDLDPTGRYSTLKDVLMHSPQIRGCDPVRNPRNQDITTYAKTRHRETLHGGAAASAAASLHKTHSRASLARIAPTMLTVKDRLDLLTQQWMPSAAAAHSAGSQRARGAVSLGVARLTQADVASAPTTANASNAKESESENVVVYDSVVSAMRADVNMDAKSSSDGDCCTIDEVNNVTSSLDGSRDDPKPIVHIDISTPTASASDDPLESDGRDWLKQASPAPVAVSGRTEVSFDSLTGQDDPAQLQNFLPAHDASSSPSSARGVGGALELAPDDARKATAGLQTPSSVLSIENILPDFGQTRSPVPSSTTTQKSTVVYEKPFWDNDEFFADPTPAHVEIPPNWEAELEADIRFELEERFAERAVQQSKLAQVRAEQQRKLAEIAAERERRRLEKEAEAATAARRKHEKAILLHGNSVEDERALLSLRNEALDDDVDLEPGNFSSWIVIRVIILNSFSEVDTLELLSGDHVYVGVCVRLNQSVTQLKGCVWRFLQSSKIKPPRLEQSDCLFVCDGDDFIVDEGDVISKLPYVHFALTHSIIPQFVLVDKRELQLLQMQVLSAVGTPLVWTVSQVENDHFRKQMNRIHFNKFVLRSDAFEETRIPDYLPKQFAVQIQVTENVTKTVSVSHDTTVGSLTESFFAQFRVFLEKLLSDSGTPAAEVVPSNFVLKFKGREEYLLNPHAIISCNAFVIENLRKRDRVEYILLRKNRVAAWEQKSDWFEQRKYGNLNPAAAEDLLSDGIFAVAHGEDISKISSTMRVRASRLENVTSYLAAAGFRNPAKNPVNLWLTAGVFVASDPILDPQGQKLFAESVVKQQKVRGDAITADPNGPPWYCVRTEETSFRGGNPPSWSGWLDTKIEYKNLPWASLLHVVLWASPASQKKNTRRAVCVGWVNLRLTDYRDRVRQGFHSLLLLRGAPNPQGITADHTDLSAPKLSLEIEVKDSPYFPSDLKYSVDPDLMRRLPSPTFGEFRDSLEKLFERDPLYRLHPDDKTLLWQYRGWCFSEVPQKSIFKFCYAVPWADGGLVREFYALIDNWPLLDDPRRSLELLQPRFLDRHIRGWVVRNLMLLTDLELSQYLLQLVQALKHEIHNDSVLARFLLQRSWLNTRTIGHEMFWIMKTEAQTLEFAELFELLLEAFVRGCGPSFREELIKETQMADSLVFVAKTVQATAKNKRKKVLDAALDPSSEGAAGSLGPRASLPRSFLLTATPQVVASSVIVEKCKTMESKTCPLWLVFKNLDPFGDDVSTIFKVGDDLRQDQLTLQMIDIFDQMWLRAGLDLRMVVYPVVATGADTGWIGVVHNARTCAEIQKATGAGALKAAFNEKVLANWLRKENPSDIGYNNAVDNFIRSCAGCAVATYVLGIGDRHNDNIMLRKNGQMFHIDFGKFLGNAQMAMGVSRDRAPFVFTPDMAYVMGGTQSEEFARFTDYCCRAYNVVRENAHGVINLFAMMVSTGIPELQSEDDLEYLTEAFALDLDQAAAAAKFKGLINQSLSTTSTRLNFAVHLLANPG